MECKKFVKFRFLLFMIITNWRTATCMIAFTQFQKLSDGRSTSELGTTNVHSVETCIYLCINTPSCLSVSYERLTQQCDLGSNVPEMEQVTVNPDWVVYYKTGLNASPSGTSPPGTSASGTSPPGTSATGTSTTGTSTTGNIVLVNLVMPWTEANNYCYSTYSGHLAHIKSESVMNQIIPLLDENPHVMFAWVGATDLEEEGIWTWTDNTPVDDGYTRWRELQPENTYGNEDCMLVFSTAYQHEWQPVNCLSLLVSICQY